MRKTVHPEKKHQSFGVSFPPHLRNAARTRAYSLEVNLSRYLQHLVEADIGIAPLPSTFERSGALHSKPNGKAAPQRRQARQPVATGLVKTKRNIGAAIPARVAQSAPVKQPSSHASQQPTKS
jgi:hypothetical protein